MMLYRSGKRVEAARAFRRSLELEPNNPEVLAWLVSIYVRAGKSAPGRALAGRLLSIDPLTPLNRTWLAWFDMFDGNPGEMLAVGGKWMEADPPSQFACWVTLWGMIFNGRLHEEGHPLLDRLIRQAPESGIGRWASAFKPALEGNRDAALEAVTPELVSWARSDDVASLSLAMCYASLGMQEDVLGWLANAVAMGLTNYMWVADNPYLMQVMRGPRAKEFLDRFRVLWETQEL
jgi:tetratricopeptide (TPR) repeat protein